jgi:hypothetical protein
MKKPPTTTFTASKFAAIVGCDRHQLIKRLGENSATPASATGRGSEYGLRDLVNALAGGDAAAERVRKVRLECEKLEHDLSVKRRDYVPTAEIIKLNEGIAVAIREIIWRSPLDEGARRAILHELVALKDHPWGGGGNSIPLTDSKSVVGF